jgi:hypothetical protein
MAQAYTDLQAAIARAERALAVLEQQQDKNGIAFKIHVLGLGFQVTYAQEELDRAEQFAFDMLGQRRAREETPRTALDAEFPAGTIVACPECGEGLYKTTTRVTTADLVLDDGTLLTPLNRSIPARDAWAPLACPFCGGRP